MREEPVLSRYPAIHGPSLARRGAGFFLMLAVCLGSGGGPALAQEASTEAEDSRSVSNEDEGGGLLGQGEGSAPPEPTPAATVPVNPFGGLLERAGNLGNQVFGGLSRLAAAQRFKEKAFAGIDGVVERQRMVGGLYEVSFWIPAGGAPQLARNMKAMGAGDGGLVRGPVAERAAEMVERFGGPYALQLVGRVDPGLGGSGAVLKAAGVFIGYTDTAEPPLQDGSLTLRMTHAALQAGLADLMPGGTVFSSRRVPNRPRRVAQVSQTKGAPVVNGADGTIDLPFSMHSVGPAGLLPRRMARTAGVNGSGATRLAIRVTGDGGIVLDVVTYGNYRAFSNGGLGNALGEAMGNAARQIPGDAAGQLEEVGDNPSVARVAITENRFTNHGGSGSHLMRGTITLNSTPLQGTGVVPRRVFIDRSWAGADITIPAIPISPQPTRDAPAPAGSGGDAPAGEGGAPSD